MKIFKMTALFFSVLVLLPAFLSAGAIQKDKILFYEGELAPSEQEMFADSTNGSFKATPFIKTYFVSSGLTNEKDLGDLMALYEKKFAAIKDKVSGLKDEALADALCRTMHKEILREYSYDAIFPEPLIRDGIFNCVSSSAVYADLLTRFGFSYEFQFVEKHVFLKALVNGKKVVCEPTNPLGYNPGANVLTNADGSVQSALRTEYAQITPADQIGFIASRYYDGRMFARIPASDTKSFYLLGKKGFFLNPNDAVLSKNFTAFTQRYLSDLFEKGQYEEARKIACDSLAAFVDKSEIEGAFSFSFEGIGARYLGMGNPSGADSLFSNLEAVSGTNYSRKVAEHAYSVAVAGLLKSNELSNAYALAKRGSEKFPNITALEELYKNTGLVLVEASKDLGKIISSFEARISEKPNDERLKDEYLFTLQSIMKSAIERGAYSNADRSIESVYACCGKARGDKAVDISYGNAIYEYLKNRAHADAVLAGRAACKWGTSGLAYQNYLVAVERNLAGIYSNGNLDLVIAAALEEARLGKTNASFVESMGNALSGIFRIELLSRLTNAAPQMLGLMTNLCGPAGLEKALLYSFNSAIYEFSQKKEFDKAVLVGDMALNVSASQTVWKNYVYALFGYARMRITEKDLVGAMAALTARIKKYPQIAGLSDIPDSVFRGAVVDLLKAGQEKSVKAIFDEFGKALSADKLEAFADRSYVSASYALAQEKQFRQSYLVAESRLVQKDSSQLFENYRSSLYRSVDGDTNVTETALISLYAASIKKFPKAAGLKTDLTSLVTKLRVEDAKKNDLSACAQSMKRLSAVLDASSLSNAAGHLYVNVTHQFYQGKNYLKSLDAAEEGFSFTSYDRLYQNYIASFWAEFNDRVGKKEFAKAKELVVRLKKRFPNVGEISRAEEVLAANQKK